MKDDSELKQAFRQLAQYMPREASPAVETRLLATLRTRRRALYRSWLVAAAACLIAAFALVFWLRRPAPRPHITRVPSSFVLLPYGQSDVPLEHGVVVRVQVQSGTGTVDADLLVGQDGIARAIRYTE
jgi:hypothetical protein